MNMAGRYVDRMLLLLELVAYLLAYTDTDQCQVCQTPLIQHPRVPWRHLLTNTTKHFNGSKYRNMVRVLPNHSFVSGTHIQVCIGHSTYIIARGIWSRFGFVTCCFLTYVSRCRVLDLVHPYHPGLLQSTGTISRWSSANEANQGHS